MKHIKKFENINDWVLTDMDLVGYYEEITSDEYCNYVSQNDWRKKIDIDKIKRIEYLLKPNEGEKVMGSFPPDDDDILHIYGRFIVNNTHPNARFNFEAFEIEDGMYAGSFSYDVDKSSGGQRVTKWLRFDDWSGILRFLKDKNII